MRKAIALFLFSLLAASAALAAPASPVTVSGVTVAGNTLTVTTSAAHGLSAATPSAFCISGSSVTADNVCSVVLTAPTGTTFTFTLSGGSVCAASCGTVLHAKRVIWLQTSSTNGGYQVSYVLWLATTSGLPGKTSSWSGASAAESNAIAAGTIIELSRSQFFPLATSLANAEAQLSNDWIAQQAQITASVQPGAFFGNYFDGTGWLQ